MDDLLFVSSDLQTPVAVGGAIFEVPAGATSMEITIDDRFTERPDAGWAVTNETGERVASGEFCGSTTVALPSDAASLSVWVETTGLVEINQFPPVDTSPLCSPTASGTVGSINVAWST